MFKSLTTSSVTTAALPSWAVTSEEEEEEEDVSSARGRRSSRRCCWAEDLATTANCDGMGGKSSKINVEMGKRRSSECFFFFLKKNHLPARRAKKAIV